MSKHTPGPWEIDEDGGIYARSQTVVIGQVYDSSDYPCLDGNEAEVDAEATANAKLIAAAPELLNAVRFLLSNPDNRISAADLAAANAVIDKATK
jgi:hypothetical protein